MRRGCGSVTATATCTSCSCGILPRKWWRSWNLSKSVFSQGLWSSSTPATAVHPESLRIWLGTHLKSHPILRNQETGGPRLGSPVFSHGKLYRPAQVDPSLNYELCFQACWASCWPRCRAILSFCVSLIHICLRQARTSDTHSKQACYLPAAKWLLHIPHVSQPSAPMRYPETKRQHWSRFQYNSPQNVESLEVLKATTPCFGAKPWKNPVSFLPKIPWLGWGAEDSHLKSPTDLSSPGHWSRRFISTA